MRLDRRLLAVAGLIVVSLAAGWFERRTPAWVHLDPLLRPFGAPAPEGIGEAMERRAEVRTPVPVHLDRATLDDLVALPGIGPSTAARILAWRDTVGVVDDVDRLREVRGIGPAKVEALRPWILLEQAPVAADTTSQDDPR